MNINSVKTFLSSPSAAFGILGARGLLNWIPDQLYLKIIWRLKTGKKLNLTSPKTFNEKLQWLKLYNRKPEYTQMVDKYEAKKYVAERIGEKYIVPTYGIWNRFDEIDFGILPNQFVLKCTHDSGGLVICKDKAKFDIVAAKKKIEKSLKRNYYFGNREWPYKNVQPRIIAEVYLEDDGDDALVDYKFFCFNGVPKVMYISRDHGKTPRTDFFDMDFKHLPFWFRDPNAEVTPEKPSGFAKMRSIAEILSNGIPFLRVDFYQVNNHIFLGELTFYHMSGYAKVCPSKWDDILGSWIDLSTTLKDGKVAK